MDHHWEPFTQAAQTLCETQHQVIILSGKDCLQGPGMLNPSDVQVSLKCPKYMVLILHQSRQYIHTHICMCVYVYVCVSVCTYVQVNTGACETGAIRSLGSWSCRWS